MTTPVQERLEANIGGQAQKRGLIPRTPAGDRVLADAAVWLTGEYPDAVRWTRQRTLDSGVHELAVDLHPAVPPLVITADEDGRIAVRADTAVAGPGYHRFVGRVLERLASEVGIDWSEGDGALTFAEYTAGLEAAGLVDVSVTATHEVADGMHGAIVRARKPVPAGCC